MTNRCALEKWVSFWAVEFSVVHSSSSVQWAWCHSLWWSVHAIDHPLMAKGNGWSYTSYTMQAFLFSFVKNLTSSDQRSIDGVCTRNIGCRYSVVGKTKLGDSTVFAWRSWRSRWNSFPHSWGSNSIFFANYCSPDRVISPCPLKLRRCRATIFSSTAAMEIQ